MLGEKGNQNGEECTWKDDHYLKLAFAIAVWDVRT